MEDAMVERKEENGVTAVKEEVVMTEEWERKETMRKSKQL